jgi:hypothetical protein
MPPVISKSPSRQTIASEESGFLEQIIKQKTKGFKTLRRKKTKIDEDIEMGEPIPPSSGPNYPYEETRAGEEVGHHIEVNRERKDREQERQEAMKALQERNRRRFSRQKREDGKPEPLKKVQLNGKIKGFIEEYEMIESKEVKVSKLPVL